MSILTSNRVYGVVACMDHPFLTIEKIIWVFCGVHTYNAWIPFYVDLVAHEDSMGGVLSSEPVPGWIPLCEGQCMHPMWCDSIRRTVRAIEPQPAGHYRYSDVGYYLLQDILESQWDLSLEQLADSLIHVIIMLFVLLP